MRNQKKTLLVHHAAAATSSISVNSARPWRPRKRSQPRRCSRGPASAHMFWAERSPLSPRRSPQAALTCSYRSDSVASLAWDWRSLTCGEKSARRTDRGAKGRVRGLGRAPVALGQKGPTHSLMPWLRNDVSTSANRPQAMGRSYRPMNGNT